MNRRIRLSSSSKKDIREISRWLNRQRHGFGDQFEELFDIVGRRPHSFRSVGDNIRKALLKKFSYMVYYRFDDAIVEIIAIMHTARGPDYLKNHLESRNGLTDDRANENDDDIEDDTQADG